MEEFLILNRRYRNPNESVKPHSRATKICTLYAHERNFMFFLEFINPSDITVESQKNHQEYYGVTHLLTDGDSNVNVICLKRVM